MTMSDESKAFVERVIVEFLDKDGEEGRKFIADCLVGDECITSQLMDFKFPFSKYLKDELIYCGGINLEFRKQLRQLSKFDVYSGDFKEQLSGLDFGSEEWLKKPLTEVDFSFDRFKDQLRESQLFSGPEDIKRFIGDIESKRCSILEYRGDFIYEYKDKSCAKEVADLFQGELYCGNSSYKYHKYLCEHAKSLEMLKIVLCDIDDPEIAHLFNDYEASVKKNLRERHEGIKKDLNGTCRYSILYNPNLTSEMVDYALKSGFSVKDLLRQNSFVHQGIKNVIEKGNLTFIAQCLNNGEGLLSAIFRSEERGGCAGTVDDEVIGPISSNHSGFISGKSLFSKLLQNMKKNLLENVVQRAAKELFQDPGYLVELASHAKDLKTLRLLLCDFSNPETKKLLEDAGLSEDEIKQRHEQFKIYLENNCDASPFFSSNLNFEKFRYFKDLGLKLDIVNSKGETPLFFCADIKVLEDILETKVIDLNHKDHFGKTALCYYLEESRYKQILLLLTKHNGNLSDDTLEGTLPILRKELESKYIGIELQRSLCVILCLIMVRLNSEKSWNLFNEEKSITIPRFVSDFIKYCREVVVNKKFISIDNLVKNLAEIVNPDFFSVCKEEGAKILEIEKELVGCNDTIKSLEKELRTSGNFSEIVKKILNEKILSEKNKRTELEKKREIITTKLEQLKKDDSLFQCLAETILLKMGLSSDASYDLILESQTLKREANGTINLQERESDGEMEEVSSTLQQPSSVHAVEQYSNVAR